jgi:hypothetical protein
MTTNKAIPIKSSAIYKAAELINTAGPRSMEVLQAEIDCGPKKGRQEKFAHAFSIGWLCETPAGTIDVTEKTRQYFSELEPSAKPIGQITPAQYRPSVFVSQGLSKKNIPNRRGTRLDIPEWSVRGDVVFHTKA